VSYLHKCLSWSPYVSNVIIKASRTLNILKHNLNNCASKVKESAYVTMFRPHLDYAFDVWDPHHVGDIVKLEKVQQRAARWVMNEDSTYSSVMSLLNQLSSPSLQSRVHNIYIGESI